MEISSKDILAYHVTSDVFPHTFIDPNHGWYIVHDVGSCGLRRHKRVLACLALGRSDLCIASVVQIHEKCSQTALDLIRSH